jgi:phage-related protein
MAFDLFAPEVAASPGTNVKKTASLFETEFGDGYSQAIPKGLNSIRRNISLSWQGLTEAQAQYIDDFLTAQGGNKTFLFQPYGYSAPIKWTCKEWTVSPGVPWRVTAEFRESFLLSA